MIPILYDDLRVRRGVIPTDAGDAQLLDAISCTITERLNDSYELELTYPIIGRYSEEIKLRRLIMAKANAIDPPQIFRIYKINKELHGNYTIYAQHISYDLRKASIYPSSANVAQNCTEACALLSTTTFSITTDIDKTAVFAPTEPSSKRSWLGGRDGSLLDIYGGELFYNNYNIQLLSARGSVKDFIVQYGNNLTQLSQELDGSKLCTTIRLYYRNGDGTYIRSQATPTGLTLDFAGTVYIDVTSEYDAAPTVATLNTHATQYVTDHPELTNPLNNITCNFVQFAEAYQQDVGLGDTIHLYYNDFGIDTQLKIIETTYDTINERYTDIQVGDPKPFLIA